MAAINKDHTANNRDIRDIRLWPLESVFWFWGWSIYIDFVRSDNQKCGEAATPTRGAGWHGRHPISLMRSDARINQCTFLNTSEHFFHEVPPVTENLGLETHQVHPRDKKIAWSLFTKSCGPDPGNGNQGITIIYGGKWAHHTLKSLLWKLHLMLTSAFLVHEQHDAFSLTASHAGSDRDFPPPWPRPSSLTWNRYWYESGI